MGAEDEVSPGQLVFTSESIPLLLNEDMAQSLRTKFLHACSCCGLFPMGRSFRGESDACGCNHARMHYWGCGKCAEQTNGPPHCRCEIEFKDDGIFYSADGSEIP